VYFNNDLSKPTGIDIGVPQGSTLGPLLFMVFVNDLPMYVNKGRCTMYADDTIIHVSNENVIDVSQNLNDVLTNVSEWYIANRLALNIDKSNTMLIGRTIDDDLRNQFSVVLDSSIIQNVHCTKYLGIHIDEHLKFDLHINELIKKLSIKLSWFARLRHVVPKPVLLLTSKTYIQPIFDYACTVWDCTNLNVSRIQRLQNRAARIVCSNFDFINTRGEDLVRQLHWQNITQHINYFLSTQMYNSIHGYAPSYLVNSIVMACDASDVNTRRSDTMNVEVPFCNTDVMKKSFIFRGSVTWNRLPSNVQESRSLDEFKCQVRSLFSG
jgi:hypothetical protein